MRAMTSKGSSREGRGESSRSSHSAHGGKQQNRASAAAEPLFPRVHVSETRNGPKAPPRNKMALYEQLTVPSQHFVQRQSSGSVWPPMNPAYTASQYAPFGYMPCYVSPPQGLPFHHAIAEAGSNIGMAALGNQRSLVMNSEVDKELQRVPRDVGEPTNVDVISNCATTSVAPSSFQEFGMVSYAQASSSQQYHKSNNTNTNGFYHNNNVSDNNVNIATNVNREHKRLRNEDDFTVPTYSFPKDGVTNDIEVGSIKQHQQQRYNQPLLSKDVNKSSKAPQVLEGTGLSSPAAIISPRDHSKVNGGIEQICSSNICESAVGSDNKSNDFSQSLHEEQVSGDGDSTASMVDSVGKIAARDVVGAVGEKEFWKTRKTLLRQQRIFATQVFELHRVVKVQHLLAETPQLLVEPDHPSEKNLCLKPAQMCREIGTLEVRKKTPSTCQAVTSLPFSQPNKDQARKEQRDHQQKPQEHQQHEVQEKDHQYTTKVSYIPSTTQEKIVPPTSPATLLQSNSCSNSSTYPMGPFSSNSWGYAAFPNSSLNQWAMLPPSACQPYVFQAPPNAAQMLPPPGYSAAYQPMFHAQAPNGVGYEMFSMVSAAQRPQMEIPPLYWQHQMFPTMPPNSGWYAFPHQFYDSSSQTMLLPPKLPTSANSTVMSPMDHPQIQEQHLHQQHIKSKFPDFSSAHNSDMSSIAQNSEYHVQHQQEQSQRRGQTQQRCDVASGTNCSMPFSYLSPSERQHQELQSGSGHGNRAGGGFNEKHRAMKVVPRAVMATPESAAGILKSIQRERH